MAVETSFEWDEAKRQSNLAQHGVDFEAARRLTWAEAVEAPDRRRDYSEERVVALGPIDGRLHAMVFTRRGDAVRVISLRRANDREQRAWAARTS